MEPAERWDRLKAALIDALAALALSLIGAVPLVGWVGKIGLVALVFAQLYLLATQGQTIGKKVMDIRIVRRDTLENGGFMTNVLIRTLANFLLCLIPAYPLLDSLLIFREDRRCAHDWLAGTIVVKS